MENKKYYTTQEVASLAQITESRVKQLISCAKLAGEKINNVWHINPASVEKFLQERQESQLRTDRKSNVNVAQGLAQVIAEKEKQIKFLKDQLQIAQQQHTELIRSREQSDIRKDILLKSAIDNINIYKDLNKNIINAISYNESQAIEILQDGYNIAIIEDDPDQTELLKVNLEKAGFRVYDFDNVSNPTPLLKNFDLILLDLNLEKTDPISDAEKWIDILKQHNRQVPPVIIISGEEEERIEKAKEKINPVAVFKKPLNLPELIEKISSLNL